MKLSNLVSLWEEVSFQPFGLCWSMQNRFSTAKNSSQRNDQVAVVGIRKVGNGNSSNVEFKVSAGTTAAFPYLFDSLKAVSRAEGK